jgi:hypothetical protein
MKFQEDDHEIFCIFPKLSILFFDFTRGSAKMSQACRDARLPLRERDLCWTQLVRRRAVLCHFQVFATDSIRRG